MIGILGGTFDPVHFGHLRTALDVQQALSLDEIRFIPAGEPPHRDKPVADALTRLAMVRLATHGQKKFSVDDREIHRAGPSYMVDTLASLKKDFPQQQLCLLLGTDAFNGLPQWHNWQQIFELAGIVLMQRPEDGRAMPLDNTMAAELEKRLLEPEQFCQQATGHICMVPVTQLDISASRIRQMWQQGRDIQFFLPDEVIALIQQQDIY